MNSIASWSPSQSEPLIVSYMCHSQLSSPMLPSAAPMPPCAATVCERVGNTFESTATRRPACASSSAARRPEPPAPTMTASNLRIGIVISFAPQDRSRPDQIEGEHQRNYALRCKANARGVEVVHEDVAHADPRVVEQRRDEEHREEAQEPARDHRLPVRSRVGRVTNDIRQREYGVERHHH